MTNNLSKIVRKMIALCILCKIIKKYICMELNGTFWNEKR